MSHLSKYLLNSPLSAYPACIIYICSLRYNRKRRYGFCHSKPGTILLRIESINSLPMFSYLCNCYRIVTYVTFFVITLQHRFVKVSLIIIHLIFDLYLLFVSFCCIYLFILTKYIIRIIPKDISIIVIMVIIEREDLWPV